jgi:Fe-S cluster assembly iron-binding protein IscA
LTFTPTNWSTAQTVQLAALHDDDTAGGGGALELTAPGLATRTVAAPILDDDVQAITAAPGALTVGEGAAAELDVRLAFRPAAPLTLAVSTLAATTATVSPATLTFTPDAYATPQRLTVTAMEDADAAPSATTLRLEQMSTGLTTDVAVTVVENDVLTIETNPASISLAEGGTATFGVRLTAMPLAAVTLTATSGDATAATAAPSPLFFDATNWSTYQTVTVTGVEDVDLAAESVAIQLAASGLPGKAVAATISDNDSQQLVLSTTSVSVTEGSTASASVSLRYQPAGNVAVALSSSHPGSASVPASLTFTPTNYATPQALTVTGVQDANAANETATITLTATGVPAATITAAVTDNDVLALEVSASTLTVSEGGTATFQVRLTAQPAATTTVSLTSNDTGAATVDPMLTFTTTSWSTFQTVTVTGVDDADLLNETPTIVVSSAGLANANVNVTVTDNDQLAILTSTSAISLGEAGSATFTVRLSNQPGAPTAVTCTSSDTGAATVAPPSLSFSTTSWATPQTVTVSGVPDVDLANESVTITCSSAGLADRAVTAIVTDDDAQALLVNPGALTVNEGGSTSFGVTLQFQPAGNVTVTLASDDPAIATVDRTSLTFTPANYNLAQIVNVSGTQDINVSSETTTVKATAPGVPPATVLVTTADDDTIGLVVTATSLSVSESGSSGFGVSLTNQPPGDVTVTVNSGNTSAATVSPGTLTFTPADWNSSQTVIVRGVDDANSNHEGLNVVVRSGAAQRIVAVAVADDDLLLVSRSSLTLCEGVNIALMAIPISEYTLSVSLASPPLGTSSLTATIGGSSIVFADPNQLTLTDLALQSVWLSTSFIPASQSTTLVVSAPGQSPRPIAITVLDQSDPQCTPSPRCGDGICNGSETRASCPIDCGTIDPCGSAALPCLTNPKP